MRPLTAAMTRNNKNSGELLGAELHGPDGEHLAHLLAWAISLKLTVNESLRMPFYHPVVEEGFRIVDQFLFFGFMALVVKRLCIICH